MLEPNLSFFKHKTVLLWGMARSGQAMAAFLTKSGVPFLVWDDNESVRDRFPDDRFCTPNDVAWKLGDLCVTTPALRTVHRPPEALERARNMGAEILGDIACFLECFPSLRTVAITGTLGKSTTASLVAHGLKQARKPMVFGGNIGTPVFDLVDALKPDTTAVLEVSSAHLETLGARRFSMGGLTNIVPNHLDFHGSLEIYTAAKNKIFEAPQTSADGAGKKPAWLADQSAWDAAFSNISGPHNRSNGATAYGLLVLNGVSDADVYDAFATFEPLNHRQTVLGTKNGVAYVNDSKATHFDAARAALERFSQTHRLFWIVGGVYKTPLPSDLVQAFSDSLEEVLLIGASALPFAQAMPEGVRFRVLDTLEQALDAAHVQAQTVSQSLVLLSPGCQSFDQFANFEARGHAMRTWFETVRAA